MRQTLLRIRIDDLWSLEPADGLAAIGVGYLLVPWLVLGLWWAWRKERPWIFRSDDVTKLIVWCGLAGVVFSLPSWAPRPWIPIYGYGFMLFVGFFVAGWTAARRAERVGVSQDLIWDLGMWLFFAGIFGARLFYLVQKSDQVFRDRNGLGEYLGAAVNLPDGGLVLYGGLLLGAAAFFLFCHVYKLRPLFLADIVVPAIFVGLAFGRFGCFLNGCCFGDACDLPWAVSFPKGSVPYEVLLDRGLQPPGRPFSIPLHPTQLYSVIDAIILAVLTSTYFKYRNRDGAVLTLALIVYPISRIFIEILRGDEAGQFGTSLTISQWISLALLAGGILLAVWNQRVPAVATASRKSAA